MIAHRRGRLVVIDEIDPFPGGPARKIRLTPKAMSPELRKRIRIAAVGDGGTIGSPRVQKDS